MNRLLFVFAFVLAFSCTKEDYEVEGSWKIESVQCNSYSFFETTQLTLQVDDSLGNIGFVIPLNQDSVIFEYVYKNDQLTFIGAQESDWINTHNVIAITDKKLILELKTDSCTREYRFKK